MSDIIDDANDYMEKWLSHQIAEHQYQLGQAAHRDIEAELCNGCSYATKASWGKTCEAWAECRKDMDDRQRAEKRRGRA